MQISKPHTSLPKAKQDPAAHVPGTPTLCQYKPKSAPRCVAPPLLPGLRSVVFGRVKGFDYGLSPPGSWPFYRPSPQPKTDRTGAGGAGGERECGSAEFGDSIKKGMFEFWCNCLELDACEPCERGGVRAAQALDKTVQGPVSGSRCSFWCIPMFNNVQSPTLVH